MPTVIRTDKANCYSTKTFTVEFEDEEENAVTPNEPLYWRLTDVAGNVINNRTAVLLTPATSIDITLSGNDLLIQSSETTMKEVTRVLTLKGTYDSNKGTNLEINDECVFYVKNLAAREWLAT